MMQRAGLLNLKKIYHLIKIEKKIPRYNSKMLPKVKVQFKQIKFYKNHQ